MVKEGSALLRVGEWFDSKSLAVLEPAGSKFLGSVFSCVGWQVGFCGSDLAGFGFLAGFGERNCRSLFWRGLENGLRYAQASSEQPQKKRVAIIFRQIELFSFGPALTQKQNPLSDSSS